MEAEAKVKVEAGGWVRFSLRYTCPAWLISEVRERGRSMHHLAAGRVNRSATHYAGAARGTRHNSFFLCLKCLAFAPSRALSLLLLFLLLLPFTLLLLLSHFLLFHCLSFLLVLFLFLLRLFTFCLFCLIFVSPSFCTSSLLPSVFSHIFSFLCL